ncbi:MAG: M48 family metallopeptidase [Arcobacteraceae bacterium]|nr:M48 family metallopeptidase [Arcobacteraceae bacterium]MDY0364374.1 M48 family metallopeptidase [Arcobacteraceae bacterium]
MRKYLGLLFLLIFMTGCAVSNAPVTNRTQLILMSTEQEMALGEDSYKQALNEMEVSKDMLQTQRVVNVGQRIANVANRDDFNWEFALVESKEVNAFCLPGGKVVVYTGILSIAEDDDELATVISHEIGHAIARHGAERMSLGMVTTVVGVAANIALGRNGNSDTQKMFNIAYGLGATYGVILPYSRMQELEADEIGIDLMFKAGYDIDKALSFWVKMQNNAGDKKISEFTSTHPSENTRIENIRKVISRYKN